MIYRETKDFLFRILDKEFFVFLSFLAVSTAFWFLSTLNETYEMEVKLPIKMDEMPPNAIITDPLPDTIRVTLKDKGFTLLNYMWQGDPAPLHLSFRLYADMDGKGRITPSDVQKILKPRYSETTSILNVKASHWEFYYCYGSKKKVPVRIYGNVSAATDYYVTRCVLTPDSVDVLATRNTLDTITVVYTELVQVFNIKESTAKDVGLRSIRGAKIEPSKVRLGIVTDQLTEVVVNVPVNTVNVPEGFALKTFPARVDIRVAVGVRSANLVKPEQFQVVADYADLKDGAANKIPLKITSKPRGIVKATLKNPEIEYLLETN